MKDSHTQNQFNIFKDFQKKCRKLMGRTELRTDVAGHKKMKITGHIEEIFKFRKFPFYFDLIVIVTPKGKSKYLS